MPPAVAGYYAVLAVLLFLQLIKLLDFLISEGSKQAAKTDFLLANFIVSPAKQG